MFEKFPSIQRVNHLFRAPGKSAYRKTIFLFVIQNVCCGYSKELSQ